MEVTLDIRTINKQVVYEAALAASRLKSPYNWVQPTNCEGYDTTQKILTPLQLNVKCDKSEHLLPGRCYRLLY